MRWLVHSFDLMPLAMPSPKVQQPGPAPTPPDQNQPDQAAQDAAADAERIKEGARGRASTIFTGPNGDQSLGAGSLAIKSLGA